MRFTTDDRGLGRFLTSSGMQSAMMGAALNVLEHAERIAPDKDGVYKKSFGMEPAKIMVPTRFKQQERAGAYVYNTVPYAPFVEAYSYKAKRRNTLSSLTRRW